MLGIPPWLKWQAIEKDLAESGIIRWVSHKGRGVEIFNKILPSPYSVRAFYKVLRNW